MHRVGLTNEAVGRWELRRGEGSDQMVVDPCEVGGAARRRRRRWQRLVHALHGNGDSEFPPSPSYSSPDTDEEEDEDGVAEPTNMWQRVGPSWDVGCADDREDARPAAPLHQFTPNIDAEARWRLPGGALALERRGGVGSLTELCLTVLVLHHPVLFWGWHGSQAVAEWLTAVMERLAPTIGVICRYNIEVLQREYRRMFDIETLVCELLHPLNQRWQAHREQNQTAEQRAANRFAGCLLPSELWQHASRVAWIYGVCRAQQRPLAVGWAMMRQHHGWLPDAQRTLERLWAIFESAAWALLSDAQRLQVMIAVTFRVAANWQFNNDRVARSRDEAEGRIREDVQAGAPEAVRQAVRQNLEIILEGVRLSLLKYQPEEEEDGEAEEEEELEEEEWEEEDEWFEEEEELGEEGGTVEWEEEGLAGIGSADGAQDAQADAVSAQDEVGEEEDEGEEEQKAEVGEEEDEGEDEKEVSETPSDTGGAKRPRDDDDPPDGPAGVRRGAITAGGASEGGRGGSERDDSGSGGGRTEWWWKSGRGGSGASCGSGSVEAGARMTRGAFDVVTCSRCGEVGAALPLWPIFAVVPCALCGWDTGLEYSDAEAYDHGYGGICVVCGASQTPQPRYTQ